MVYSYRIKELKRAWERQHGGPLTMRDLSKATGISAPTLSRLTDLKGYVTNTRYIASLCLFFGVKPSELMMECPHPFDPPSDATPKSLNLLEFEKYKLLKLQQFENYQEQLQESEVQAWIRVVCKCGKVIKYHSEWAGEKAHCPRCGVENIICAEEIE